MMESTYLGVKVKLITGLLVILNCIFLHSENTINYHPLMTEHIIKNKNISETFFVLDVGASGGIGSQWQAFGPLLSATGFDPLVNEVERLNQACSNKRVKYLPYFIVSGDKKIDGYCTADQVNVYGRSSSSQFLQASNIDYQQTVFNSGQPLLFTDQKISLDQFCLKNKLGKVDFIKTDTDGSDYKVLRGAKRLLQDEALLGLLIECDLNGNFHPYSNAFRNIDYLLVEAGFTLFELSTTTYTKKDLPGRFLYSIPAQTTSGQVCQGDALYLRDFVRMKKEGKQVPTPLLIKMACLQEIFGLPDCAAELLIAYRDQLSPVIDVDCCLNLLARNMNLYPTYQDHMTAFNEKSDIFFPPK